jgi:hypothetical protein
VGDRVTVFDQDSVEQFQRDLINITRFEVDEKLRTLTGRELIPADEVVDVLLDLRQLLDSYYIHQRPRGEST